MACENPSWGYTRIHGALLNLDIKAGRVTIRRILKDRLIEPAPTRGRRIPWAVFLKMHWKAIAAIDVGGSAFLPLRISRSGSAHRGQGRHRDR